LAAIYPANAHVDLVEALSGIDFSLQRLTSKLVKARKLLALKVGKESEVLFRSLNDPADLNLAQ